MHATFYFEPPKKLDYAMMLVALIPTLIYFYSAAVLYTAGSMALATWIIALLQRVQTKRQGTLKERQNHFWPLLATLLALLPLAIGLTIAVFGILSNDAVH